MPGMQSKNVRYWQRLGATVSNSGNGAPTIDLIYDSDCPNIERARSAIREALRSVEAAVNWKEWDRAHPDTPDEFLGFGSPTVLVDGRDIGCDETGGEVTGADSCRIYMDECGCMCGAPSSVLILAALTDRFASHAEPLRNALADHH